MLGILLLKFNMLMCKKCVMVRIYGLWFVVLFLGGVEVGGFGCLGFGVLWGGSF